MFQTYRAYSSLNTGREPGIPLVVGDFYEYFWATEYQAHTEWSRYREPVPLDNPRSKQENESYKEPGPQQVVPVQQVPDPGSPGNACHVSNRECAPDLIYGCQRQSPGTQAPRAADPSKHPVHCWSGEYRSAAHETQRPPVSLSRVPAQQKFRALIACRLAEKRGATLGSALRSSWPALDDASDA
jgi:hypothetical protein